MTSSDPPFSRIGIVGLGLIGGSIALAVRQLWPGVGITALDRPEILEAAMARGVIDAAVTDGVRLIDLDLLILAAPVRQNVAVLGELAPHLTHVLVTDTGSTKREIVEAAEALRGEVTFVGGHPLGGAAASGLDYARPDLFRDRAWILTPHDTRGGAAAPRLTSFARALGSQPHVMTVAEHDRLMAFVSHLPQLTASALMETVGDAVGRGRLGLSGRGLMDTTRLAGSGADIWRDIVATNGDQIGPALDLLIARLQKLRRDLGAEAVTTLFERAGQWREALVAAAKGDV